MTAFTRGSITEIARGGRFGTRPDRTSRVLSQRDELTLLAPCGILLPGSPGDGELLRNGVGRPMPPTENGCHLQSVAFLRRADRHQAGQAGAQHGRAAHADDPGRRGDVGTRDHAGAGSARASPTPRPPANTEGARSALTRRRSNNRGPSWAPRRLRSVSVLPGVRSTAHSHKARHATGRVDSSPPPYEPICRCATIASPYAPRSFSHARRRVGGGAW